MRTKLEEILIAQSQNQRKYPNIPTAGFTSLERQIQQSWDYTYGIRVSNGGQNFKFEGSATAPDGLILNFLVLAVHGKLLSTAEKNSSPQAKNEIVIMNKSWYPPDTSKGDTGKSTTVQMVLNTFKNPSKIVTLDINNGIRAPGIFSVKEDLVEDITDIWDGYPSSPPILTYVYKRK